MRPVSADAANLTSDLQLSPGLWLCVLLAAIGWRRAGAGSRALLVGIGVLTLLLVPLPAVAGRIWPRLPAFVQVITAEWPMQRFYPILSAFAPVWMAWAIWIWDDQVQAEIDRLFVSYRWQDYLQWARTRQRTPTTCDR